MAAWLAALCRLLTTLLVISLFFNYMFQDSLKLETDRLGVGFSEFMAVLTTPSTPFDKQVLRRSGKTDAIGIPISRKLALGVRLVNMALITNLLLLANDVATNPGPTQTSAHFSSCDSSFSSCFSNESFVSDSSAVSDNEDSVLSTYYDLGLGDRGLRLGHWNVNYLTMAKFCLSSLSCPIPRRCPTTRTVFYLHIMILDSVIEDSGWDTGMSTISLWLNLS